MIVNEQVAIDHGLKKDEYAKICELLDRTPNITELGIFSAMWNEHCSYKSSRLHLKKLPTKGKQVIQRPGETLELLILVIRCNCIKIESIITLLLLNLIKVQQQGLVEL